MSLSVIIALVVFVIAFLGVLGLIAPPAALTLWLIAALALAVLLNGVTIGIPWRR